MLNSELDQADVSASGSDVADAGIPEGDMVDEFEDLVIGNSGEA